MVHPITSRGNEAPFNKTSFSKHYGKPILKDGVGNVLPPVLGTSSDSDNNAELCTEYNTTAADQQDGANAGFSLVIDDVDGEVDEPFVSESEMGGNRLEESSDPDVQAEASPEDKEKSDARIQQIKGEAEIRKNQFAQLLEEHAQIMQRIKQMEEGPSTLQGAAEMGPTEV